MGSRLRAAVRIDAAEAARMRQRGVMESAKNDGLLSGERDRIGGRIRQRLVQAAKERSGISSDTELLEYALAKVALEDDFGVNLLKLKGTVSRDIDLEF
jgi:hypothetical protein